MKNLNDCLVTAIRKQLSHCSDVEEKKMFGGLTFMVDGKMCICVVPGGLLCRVGNKHYEQALKKDGCTPMIMGKRTMRDYVLVDENVLSAQSDLDYWTDLCLAFNPEAKASAQKKKHSDTGIA